MDANQIAEDFRKRHGELCVPSGDWFIYPDGARRERSVFGAYVEPAKNEYERLGMVVLYHRTRLVMALDKFRRTKELVRNVAQFATASMDDQIKGLKELRKVVRQCQKNLEQAEKQRHDNRPASMIQREQDNIAHAEIREKALDEINSIRI